MSLTTFKQPFGVYSTPTLISNPTRATLLASLANLINLIPNPTSGVATTYAPDFDEISPNVAAKLVNELTAIKNTVIGAATGTDMA